MIKEGEVLYLDWDFDAAAAKTIEAMDLLGGLEGGASELKNRALFWIYLLEWLVLVGTYLVAGFFLWSIMVRRKLYREVGRTRGLR